MTDWKNKKSVLAAVKDDGFTLEQADESLKKDKSIVLAAVKQYEHFPQFGYALQFADKSLKKGKGIKLCFILF